VKWGDGGGGWGVVDKSQTALVADFAQAAREVRAALRWKL